MRTSKISQDTTRIFNALSPNASTRRRTRSAKTVASFALGYDGSVQVKREEEQSSEDESVPDTPARQDIEDLLSKPNRSSRKRKYGVESPITTTVATAVVQHQSKETSPRKGQDQSTAEAGQDDSNSPRAKAKPKKPARRTTSPSGTVHIHPPSNWAEIYDTIKIMRQRNPPAPVDTMGCEELFWPTAPPAQKRYHTLTSLMLSSQTKDAVTAAAMDRLHTELVPAQRGPDGQVQQSGLTVENIIACDPKHLDNLIGKVGFHNNKTKYIKQVATILKQEYHSDIPNTIEGLVGLPGVGPKMAYLCMSAAWGIDEGIGVDVHVHRITNLWGWHKTKTPEETRMWLERWLPKDRWHEINRLLVGLGQTVCLPVGRRCGECDLAGTGLCKSEIRGWKPTERRVKGKVEIKGDPSTVEVKGEEGVRIKAEEQSVS